MSVIMMEETFKVVDIEDFFSDENMYILEQKFYKATADTIPMDEEGNPTVGNITIKIEWNK